ncbi:hypothetical protein NST44_28390 [Paenibacillus sp. FSL W8-0919]
MASWWTWHYDGLALRRTGIMMDWHHDGLALWWTRHYGPGGPGVIMD